MNSTEFLHLKFLMALKQKTKNTTTKKNIFLEITFFVARN